MRGLSFMHTARDLVAGRQHSEGDGLTMNIPSEGGVAHASGETSQQIPVLI